MTIAFVTTQSAHGSTVIGRVLPLARHLSQNHDVNVLLHESDSQAADSNINFHITGRDPFTRTAQGKVRQRGLTLAYQMLANAIRSAWTIQQIKPDVVIIVKSLPENVLAVWLWSHLRQTKQIILDVDDFELTANALTSILQRATIHWAERTGLRLADRVIVASPFLADHFEHLAGKDIKPISMIPTGIIDISIDSSQPSHQATLLYIGSISQSSGHRVDLLPEILQQVRQRIPNATLRIAGSGDDIAKLKVEFKNRGLDQAVTWSGRFSTAQIPELLRNTSMILDPIDGSVANRAKSSFRVMLAASYGLPVVTSDIGIRPYLLPQEFHERFFAKPADTAAYAEKIVTLLQNPLTLVECQKLTQHAKQFSWSTLARNYEQRITVTV